MKQEYSMIECETEQLFYLKYRNGRKCDCIVIGYKDGSLFVAGTVLSPLDNFCKKQGREIALHRLRYTNPKTRKIHYEMNGNWEPVRCKHIWDTLRDLGLSKLFLLNNEFDLTDAQRKYENAVTFIEREKNGNNE